MTFNGYSTSFLPIWRSTNLDMNSLAAGYRCIIPAVSPADSEGYFFRHRVRRTTATQDFNAYLLPKLTSTLDPDDQGGAVQNVAYTAGEGRFLNSLEASYLSIQPAMWQLAAIQSGGAGATTWFATDLMIPASRSLLAGSLPRLRLLETISEWPVFNRHYAGTGTTLNLLSDDIYPIFCYIWTGPDGSMPSRIIEDLNIPGGMIEYVNLTHLTSCALVLADLNVGASFVGSEVGVGATKPHEADTAVYALQACNLRGRASNEGEDAYSENTVTAIWPANSYPAGLRKRWWHWTSAFVTAPGGWSEIGMDYSYASAGTAATYMADSELAEIGPLPMGPATVLRPNRLYRIVGWNHTPVAYVTHPTTRVSIGLALGE